MRKLILCVAVAVGIAGGAWAGSKLPVPQPEKQEQKAQPASGQGSVTGTVPASCKDAKFGEVCVGKDGFLYRNLPFDVPAKEAERYDPTSKTYEQLFVPTCKDVAPDWKLRSTPIETGDGKYHCYAFYLLEPKR